MSNAINLIYTTQHHRSGGNTYAVGTITNVRNGKAVHVDAGDTTSNGNTRAVACALCDYAGFYRYSNHGTECHGVSAESYKVARKRVQFSLHGEPTLEELRQLAKALGMRRVSKSRMIR